MLNLRWLLVLVWAVPTDVDDLLILVGVVDWHGHVVVSRYNLYCIIRWVRNYTDRPSCLPLESLR